MKAWKIVIRYIQVHAAICISDINADFLLWGVKVCVKYRHLFCELNFLSNGVWHGSLLYQICRGLIFRVRLRLCVMVRPLCRINNPSLVSQKKQWLFKLLKLTWFNLTKKQKADITIIMKAQLDNNPGGFSLMFDLWLQSSSSTQYIHAIKVLHNKG